MSQESFVAALCAPHTLPADVTNNTALLLKAVEDASAAGAKLLVFPELAVTGASCGDLFWQRALLEAAERALLELARATKSSPGLTVIVGAPLRFERELFSCAAVLRDGALLGVAPLYSGDPRLFAQPEGVSGQFALAGMQPVAFAPNLIVKCGDVAVSMAPGADVLVCPSSYPADAASDTRLPEMAVRASAETGGAFLLTCPGRGESSTDNVYTGLCAAAENGHLLAASETDGEPVIVTLLPRQRERIAPAKRTPPPEDSARNPFLPGTEEENAARCDRILNLQAQALTRRMEHIHAQGCVVGISGGLDSTLAMLVCARALDNMGLPREKLLAVTMPCFGTTSRTRSNAELLSEYLGTSFRTVDIGNAVMAHFTDIGHDPALRNAAYENAQARERTQVLMDIANDTGYLEIGTGDLSELALGWCTYSGDQMSMYGVNAGVPKTVIRAVVSRYADTCGHELLAGVLRDVVDTPVSPELLPADGEDILQKTEDLVGPYDLHDFFLWHFLARGATPAEILGLAKKTFAGEFSDEVILHWLRTFLRRFFAMQFKRSCLSDGPAVLGVSLSPRSGFRIPSDASSAIWLEELA